MTCHFKVVLHDVGGMGSTSQKTFISPVNKPFHRSRTVRVYTGIDILSAGVESQKDYEHTTTASCAATLPFVLTSVLLLNCQANAMLLPIDILVSKLAVVLRPH